MNLDDLFAKRLAQLRNQKGVSARDMSLSLGQGAGYINNIENKNNLPSMICTPKVRHFWRCIFLWQRKGKNIENTRQNSIYLL